MSTIQQGVGGDASHASPRQVRKRPNIGRMQHYTRPWLFILPGLFVLVGIIGVPIFMAARYSLHELFLYRFTSPWFIGLENFEFLISDALFRRSLVTTVIFSAGNVILVLGFGLLVAFMLSGKTVKFRTAFMALFLIPFVMTQVVVGLTFRLFIWEPEFGIVNFVLEQFSIVGPGWLIDSDFALWAAIITNSWHLTPLAILVYYAALATIPDDMIEAAQIDGANGFQVLRYVIIPMIKTHTLFISLIIMTSAFREFETIFTLTGGGPGRTTTVLSILAYNRGIASQDMGMANAIAFTMFLIMATIAWVYITLTRAKKAEAAT